MGMPQIILSEKILLDTTLNEQGKYFKLRIYHENHMCVLEPEPEWSQNFPAGAGVEPGPKSARLPNFGGKSHPILKMFLAGILDFRAANFMSLTASTDFSWNQNT